MNRIPFLKAYSGYHSLLALFFSIPAFANHSADCISIQKKVGISQVAIRLAQDPIALLKGRDINISEGLLLKTWNPDLKTTFYYSASEPEADGKVPLVDPKAKAVALFFHGSGTAKSSGRNFIHNMNYLSQQGIAGVAIDLPFHASNRGEERLKNKDEFMKWLHQVVGEVKKSGKPLYLVGHSFGPEVALQYASQFPKDLKNGGLFLISGAWGKSPAHEWMYEKVTTPGMEYLGGNEKVEDNPAGGDWAGKMAEQSDWHIRGISPDVKVKLVVGAKDEWWPPPVEGKKLPRGVHLVKPLTPYPQQLGNEGLTKKLGVVPEYNFNEAIEWTQKKIPHVEIDVVEGFGHFIFESRDPRGGPLLNRMLMDFAGVDYSKQAEQNKKTARLEARLLAENNSVFRGWVGEKNIPTILKDESIAERTLDQWRVLEFHTWKEVLASLKDSDPDYYEKRKHWIAKEQKDMPSNTDEFKRRGWNANELLADLRRYKEEKGLSGKTKLIEDPYSPKLPLISSSLVGSEAQATPFGGSLLSSEFTRSLEGKGNVVSIEEVVPGLKKIQFDYKGNEGKTWHTLDLDSPESARAFLQRAYEEAYRQNGFLAPGDNWESVIEGIRVKASNRLDHKNKIYRLEKVILEPAN
jgi:pimeloyl-ACP methyl ester carboxylesterase